MAEWTKATVLKTVVPSRGPWVRIPPPPHFGKLSASHKLSASCKLRASRKNKMQTWYVYMLLCDQKTFYIGISNNPRSRLKEHRRGKSLFTRKFSDLVLVYCEYYFNKQEAALREKQIKGWSRAKKQMFIDGKLGYNTCTELVRSIG